MRNYWPAIAALVTILVLIPIGIHIVWTITPSEAFAQGSQSPSYGNSEEVVNGTISTNTPINIFDYTVRGWTFHPENGTVRCEWGGINGVGPTVAPTTTVGFEYTSGGYFANLPNTNPIIPFNCTAESGSVTFSLLRDHN